MSKSNLVLGAILLVVAGVWATKQFKGGEETGGPAPRLFADFNREAADGIFIEGGWKGFSYQYVRQGTDWVLASAGGYPVQSAEVDKFIEAVANLRRDNLVGESDALRKTSRTGELGRKVTIMRDGGEPMAEFIIGKHPKGEWQSYFIRRADEDRIYRTKTISGDASGASTISFPGMPGLGAGGSGFDWAQYCNNTYKFAKTQIWNLDDGEVHEIWLDRPGDKFNVKLVREEDEKWMVQEGDKDPILADTAAVEDITSSLSYLAFEEIVGSFDDAEARKKYGLDKPAITLVLTMRKKVDAKPKTDEPKEGETEEAAEPEYKTFARTLSVGNKVKLPKSYDDEKGETDESEYYAVKVSGELEDGSKANYIFLVDDYKIGPLKKSLEDLQQKQEEKKDDEKKGDDDEPKDGDSKDGDDTEEKEKPSEKNATEPEKTDDPKTDEPKSDDPKTDDPKTDDPKTDDPKSDDPKTDDPKSDDPKTDEPKSDDPKSDDPKGDD